LDILEVWVFWGIISFVMFMGYGNSNEHIVGFVILFEYFVVRFVIREFGIEMS
jgi:hypothetical protein